MTIVAVSIALITKTFIIQPYYIPSNSMAPELKRGDRFIAAKFYYYLYKPRRDDIVIFLSPEKGSVGTNLIRRVVGLPGQSVTALKGRIHIDGRPLGDGYKQAAAEPRSVAGLPDRIPDDSLYVTSDNRAVISDSRSFGPISRDSMVAKAVFIFWPPARIGWIR